MWVLIAFLKRVRCCETEVQWGSSHRTAKASLCILNKWDLHEVFVDSSSVRPFLVFEGRLIQHQLLFQLLPHLAVFDVKFCLKSRTCFNHFSWMLFIKSSSSWDSSKMCSLWICKCYLQPWWLQPARQAWTRQFSNLAIWTCWNSFRAHLSQRMNGLRWTCFCNYKQAELTSHLYSDGTQQKKRNGLRKRQEMQWLERRSPASNQKDG